ncbi:hypothetical protein MBLNU459_g7267t1 [Dothideomycetes sp. NU459]
MDLMSAFYKQSFRLPAPALTEENLPDQAGRVFIVTGGYAGCGHELSKMLYARNGTVYIAGRSSSKGSIAIEKIKAACPESKGRLDFMHVDLQDLTTIKPAVEWFQSMETRLDVLTNNAGVMNPPEGSTSAQGHEMQLATNVLGPWLLTHLLTSLLCKTAASSAPGSVRVTWAASIGVEFYSPQPGGIVFEDGKPKWHSDPNVNYGQTKAANLLLSAEFARRYPASQSGVISNSWNPGNLVTELLRHQTWLAYFLWPILYAPIFGAYTELFAGWSDEAGKMENNGLYILPWGRFGGFRTDVGKSIKSEAERGTGKAAQVWEWCEKETRQYM